MIVAGYSMDLYCENPTATAEFYGETWGDCVRQARDRGWKISRDGTRCWCPECSGKRAKPQAPTQMINLADIPLS